MTEDNLFDANKLSPAKDRRKARRFNLQGLEGINTYFELIGIEELMRRPNPDAYIHLLGFDKFRGSGYKLHLFSLTLDDVLELVHAVFGAVKQHGCLIKVATVATLNANYQDKQRGKGVTIYLPFSMGEGRRTFITQLAALIAGCGYKKLGEIADDTHCYGCIYERYDSLLSPEEVAKKGGLSITEMDGKYK